MCATRPKPGPRIGLGRGPRARRRTVQSANPCYNADCVFFVASVILQAVTSSSEKSIASVFGAFRVPTIFFNRKVYDMSRYFDIPSSVCNI